MPDPDFESDGFFDEPESVDLVLEPPDLELSDLELSDLELSDLELSDFDPPDSELSDFDPPDSDELEDSDFSDRTLALTPWSFL